MQQIETTTRVEVNVHYSEPHFNPVAYCNVPGAYHFEVLGVDELMGNDKDYEHYFCYADGFTFIEGLEGIKSNLKSLVGGGSIKLRGDIPPRKLWEQDVRDGR